MVEPLTRPKKWLDTAVSWGFCFAGSEVFPCLFPYRLLLFQPGNKTLHTVCAGLFHLVGDVSVNV